MSDNLVNKNDQIKCTACKGSCYDHSDGVVDPMVPCFKCKGSGLITPDISNVKSHKPTYYEYGEKDYSLYVNDELVSSGHQADVREEIEDLIEEVTGTRVSLQEETDEGCFQVYLHSDNRYLNQKDAAVLRAHSLDIDDDPDKQTEMIKKLCNITAITEVVYYAS